MDLKKYVFVVFFIMLSPLFANSGKDIFDRYCTTCHSSTMAPMFNAPAAHDIDAWNERKANAFANILDDSIKNLDNEKKDEYSINQLAKSAMVGTDKGMPPMGTCADCTEDDLKSVIKFMSSPE